MEHRLKIGSITLPRTRQISYSGEHVGKETQMASGKIVFDLVGFRPTITYTFDALPAETMAALHELLAAGRVRTVTYISPADNEEHTASCMVEYPTAEVFTFRDGAPVWHNAQITFRTVRVS